MKISEIKFEKNITSCRTPNTVDPAQNGLERRGIEQDMLDFRPERERALPAHRAH